MAKKGRPNSGTITERGPFQFQARFSQDGKRECKTHESVEKAQEWLASLAKGAQKGRLSTTVAAHNLTLADALLRRLELKASLKSIDTQTWQAKRLIAEYPDFTSKPLYSIDEIDIQEFIEARQVAGVSNSTINRELSAISNTFNLARTKMACVSLQNPIGPTTRLPEPRGRKRRLAADEQALVLRIADRFQLHMETPIGTVIRFACASAMRLSEIGRIDWSNVDLNDGTVFIPDSKNGTSRSVPCAPSTRAILRELGPRVSGPVLGTSAAIASAWRRVKAAAVKEAADLAMNGAADPSLADRIQEFRFHDFRHEGTSRLIERTKWPNSKLRMVTGHQSDVMLARYTHLRAAELASELAAMEGGAQLSVIPEYDCPQEGDLPPSITQRQQWRAVSTSALLLKLLVWSKPIIEVAKEFGVSDVAVHKACDRLRVEKPGRGHWLSARSTRQAA